LPAIDADLNAGLIDEKEARRRRKNPASSAQWTARRGRARRRHRRPARRADQRHRRHGDRHRAARSHFRRGRSHLHASHRRRWPRHPGSRADRLNRRAQTSVLAQSEIHPRARLKTVASI